MLLDKGCVELRHHKGKNDKYITMDIKEITLQTQCVF